MKQDVLLMSKDEVFKAIEDGIITFVMFCQWVDQATEKAHDAGYEAGADSGFEIGYQQATYDNDPRD